VKYVVSTPASGTSMSGAAVLQVTRQKEVTTGVISSFPLEPAKANGEGEVCPC
jgi:hypothetical protein